MCPLNWYLAIATPVSVPWRGCVVSDDLKKMSSCNEFPSPGGDVLCRASSSPSNRRPQFPSPGGDVLCRVEQDFERLPLEFPSPGGDVLCLPIDVFMTSYFVFPSPGGDVLCRACPVHGQRPTRVSVPWRGCVVSLTVIFSFRNFRGFRPLAGMCCVGYAVDYGEPVVFPSPGGDVLCPELLNCRSFTIEVSVPWRGCVVSVLPFAPESSIPRFPSPGGDVLCQLTYRPPPWKPCFRPLAGMCCVYWRHAKAGVYLGVSVPWRGCVVSGYGNYGANQTKVSVPWRGCVVSLWHPQWIPVQ